MATSLKTIGKKDVESGGVYVDPGCVESRSEKVMRQVRDSSPQSRQAVSLNSSATLLPTQLKVPLEAWSPVQQDLFLAASQGDTKAVLASEGDINATDATGWTLLHYASARDDLTAVNTLIGSGANVNASDAQGLTPLHIAADKGLEQCIQVLVHHGADVEVLDQSELTPLFYAVKKQHISSITRLLALRANVNAKDKTGRYSRCPIHYAAARGNLEAIKILVEYGAVIDKQDEWTCLHEAVHFSQNGAINVLAHLGADIHAKDNAGRTPLLVAVRKQDKGIVETLISLGADVNGRCRFYGATALHYAVSDSSKNMIKGL